LWKKYLSDVRVGSLLKVSDVNQSERKTTESKGKLIIATKLSPKILLVLYADSANPPVEPRVTTNDDRGTCINLTAPVDII
jgi:hypothetical protein